jgi:hypothetical protein
MILRFRACSDGGTFGDRSEEEAKRYHTYVVSNYLAHQFYEAGLFFGH